MQNAKRSTKKLTKTNNSNNKTSVSLPTYKLDIKLTGLSISNSLLLIHVLFTGVRHSRSYFRFDLDLRMAIPFKGSQTFKHVWSENAQKVQIIPFCWFHTLSCQYQCNSSTSLLERSALLGAAMLVRSEFTREEQKRVSPGRKYTLLPHTPDLFMTSLTHTARYTLPPGRKRT